MSIKKCSECGCPQEIDGTYDIDEFHYKNCSKLLEWRNKKPEYCISINKHDVKFSTDYIKRNLYYARHSIGYTISSIRKKFKELKEELDEYRENKDVLKLVCLDEIYECRWDCCTAQG